MDIRNKQRAVVDALEDIKGRDIVVFDSSKHSTIFERVIIASGDSNRHVHALADNVCEKLKAAGASVQGGEGGPDTDWVLVDLGDIVVHVMHPTVRSYYNLEELWGEKPVRLKTAVKPKAQRAPRKKPAKRKAPAKRKSTPRTRRAA